MLPIIITGVVALAAGGTISYFLWDSALKGKKTRIIDEAKSEGDVLKKDKILQAKEKFLQLKAEHEKYINEKNQKIAAIENKLKQKEQSYSQKMEEYHRNRKETEAIRENLDKQLERVEHRSEELDKLHKEIVKNLETVSGLSAEEAKEQLINSLKDEAKTEAMSYINEIMDEAKMTANKEAKRLFWSQFNGQQQKLPLKMPFLYSTSKTMKSKAYYRTGR